VPPDIPDALALSLYRIVQEGVQNAIKHGAAKDIIVQLQGSHEKLTLSIVDDGVGFKIDGALKMGLGLISIRERAESLGGTLEIISTPGHGTRLYVAVPFVAQTQAKATAAG
jgi:signal transduction histidine kinase